jgi:hypothetical protein
MSLTNESQMNSATQEVKMSSNAKSKLRWLGAATAGALALAAVSLPVSPANAQIGVQIGPYGVGVGAPYYGPGPYYGYGPYYHRHYHYYDW